jgi:1,4-dihydroxy-2-naphthoate octaprenyltransferase
MIQLGWLSPKEVLVGSFVFFGIAGIIGLYLAFTRDFFILVLGIIGMGSAFFYTAPPFRFVKRGIGEVFIGLNFGVLMTLGAYFVQALDLVWEPVIASVPVALLIAGVLYINEFPDYIADRDAGKRTIVVRLGRARAAKGYVAIIVLTFIWNPIFVYFQMLPLESLVILSLLPLAFVGARTTLRSYDNIPQLVPANAATIMIHLFFSLFMSVGYVLFGLGVDLLITIAVGVIMLIVALSFFKSLTRPPPPA